jgi:acyl carrier protein
MRGEEFAMLVEEAFKEILIEKIEITPDEFKPEAKLADDFGVDSTELVEIILSLEKALGVKIPEGLIKKNLSIGEIVNIVQERCALAS